MRESEFRRILGLNFFSGHAQEAIERLRRGGLLVVPAAPALNNLPLDHGYREALLNADLTIADSAFMVLVWNLLQKDSVRRLSGLEYFDELVKDNEFRAGGGTHYVMPSRESAERNLAWLQGKGIAVRPEHVYIAPMYGPVIRDTELIGRLQTQRPRHVVIAVGGGIQERLGLYIKRALDYCPAIHCIGAAIAFRSGDQVYIPKAADRLGVGWLLRCLWRPGVYVPRYWEARKLAGLMFRYRSELPPLQTAGTAVRQESTAVATPSNS